MTTEDTTATDRGSACNDLLGLVAEAKGRTMSNDYYDLQALFDWKALDSARRIVNFRGVAYPGGESQYLAAIQVEVLEAMRWAHDPKSAKYAHKRCAIRRDELVQRFLTWPVPAEVHPDGAPGLPGRTGTNLLTAEQARQMLDYVLGEE